MPVGVPTILAATGAVPETSESLSSAWEIDITTEQGESLKLSGGGSRLDIDGKLVVEQKPEEYQRIYARFDELLRAGGSDVDAVPFQLAADAFLLGRRLVVEAFDD